MTAAAGDRQQEISARSAAEQQALAAPVDRGLAALVLVAAAAAIALAWRLEPPAGTGHLVTATALVGGSSAAALAFLAWTRAGQVTTRLVAAAALMLLAQLFARLAGDGAVVQNGVFVALALLAAYRDSRALLAGAAVPAIDLALLWSPLGGAWHDRAAAPWDEAAFAGLLAAATLALLACCRLANSELRRHARQLAAAEAAAATLRQSRRELLDQLASARRDPLPGAAVLAGELRNLGRQVDACADRMQALLALGEQQRDRARDRAAVLARTVQRFAALVAPPADDHAPQPELAGAGSTISGLAATLGSLIADIRLRALQAIVAAARAGEPARAFVAAADQVQALAARAQQAVQQLEHLAGDWVRRSPAPTPAAAGDDQILLAAAEAALAASHEDQAALARAVGDAALAQGELSAQRDRLQARLPAAVTGGGD